MVLFLCKIIIPFLFNKLLVKINSINCSIFVFLKGGSEKIRSNFNPEILFFFIKLKTSLQNCDRKIEQIEIASVFDENNNEKSRNFTKMKSRTSGFGICRF